MIRRRFSRFLLEFGVFSLLAVAATWPLARTPLTHLPLGTEAAATVPLFNTWTIWWNADRAAAGYTGYWDAPIFHPEPDAFTFSEPMPLTVLVAPVIWTAGNRVLAYNLLLFLFLSLNGWTALHLLRRLPVHRAVAWVGGAMTALLPLVHSWLGVLQLVPVFGILATCLALKEFMRRPSPRRGAILGAAFGLTYLLCAYYGLFLAVPLALSAGWLAGPRLWRRAAWAGLAAGAVAAILVCLPVARAQWRTLPARGLAHAPSYLSALSADIPDYLVPPWPHLVEPEALSGMAASARFRLSPGFGKLGLALVGAAWGLAVRRRRRWTLFCLTLASTAFFLSLGPLPGIGAWSPHRFLVDVVPGFAQARNVFRFAILVHLMVVLLAALGLQAGMAALRRHVRNPVARSLGRTVVIAAGLVAVMEILPPPQPLHEVPPLDATRAWLGWIETWTPPDAVIACLPFPFRPDVAGYEPETTWMYWQTFHGRKMINGYSGFFPSSFLNLKIPLAQFPAPEAIDLLQERGVSHCVVLRDSFPGDEARRRPDLRLEPVFRDERAGVDIYRLKPAPPP